MKLKKLMNKFFIVTGICSLCVIAGVFYSFIFYSKSKESECIIIKNHIIHEYLKEYAKPKGLKACFYDETIKYNIKKINLDLYSTKTMNVSQARILYVKAVKELLRRVNENKEMRLFFHDDPFIFENIDLTLIFYETDRHTHKSGGHVALVFCIGENISYNAYELKNKKFYNLHTESYKEALKLAQK